MNYITLKLTYGETLLYYVDTSEKIFDDDKIEEIISDVRKQLEKIRDNDGTI